MYHFLANNCQFVSFEHHMIIRIQKKCFLKYFVSTCSKTTLIKGEGPDNSLDNPLGKKMGGVWQFITTKKKCVIFLCFILYHYKGGCLLHCFTVCLFAKVAHFQFPLFNSKPNSKHRFGVPRPRQKSF